ncbi:MAG: MFS transporter [Bacteroidetes bacterium]|nr:MFS transporter [Bacteroidota bacterium]
MNLNKTSKILLIASSLWYFGEGLFGPLFALYAEKIGGDLLDITWAWAAYLMATGFFYVLVGKLVNKSKYKKQVMILGYGLNALLTFGYIFVHNTQQLFLIQIGLGIAEALSAPIWDSLFAHHLEDNTNTFHWSIANGHPHFVSGIAIAIGGLIANYISFEALFITMGIIQTIATIIQARILK